MLYVHSKLYNYFLVLSFQEQENTAKSRKRQKAEPANWYNWKDDDDGSSPGGSCGGGGGLGDLDTSGARFVF